MLNLMYVLDCLTLVGTINVIITGFKINNLNLDIFVGCLVGGTFFVLAIFFRL
jgi:hypothetical protein